APAWPPAHRVRVESPGEDTVKETVAEECPPPTSESTKSGASSNVLFEILAKDQVDFDQEQLEVFSSWEASRGHATHGQALPPGRPEHDRHSRHVRRFMHGARRYPMQFRRIVGREEELG
ncbi:unnamed protein product, partial [Durusdinium trenchii]